MAGAAGIKCDLLETMSFHFISFHYIHTYKHTRIIQYPKGCRPCAGGLHALQEQQCEALAGPQRAGDLAILTDCHGQDRAKPKLRDLHGHCDHVEHPVA